MLQISRDRSYCCAVRSSANTGPAMQGTAATRRPRWNTRRRLMSRAGGEGDYTVLSDSLGMSCTLWRKSVSSSTLRAVRPEDLGVMAPLYFVATFARWISRAPLYEPHRHGRERLGTTEFSGRKRGVQGF